MTFDDLIRANVEADRTRLKDLSAKDIRALTAAYFRENGEWGDALYEKMGQVFEALESADDADLGLTIRCKLYAYVGPYIEKQLKHVALCKRVEETAA
jgi:hypothetical protein